MPHFLPATIRMGSPFPLDTQGCLLTRKVCFRKGEISTYRLEKISNPHPEIVPLCLRSLLGFFDGTSNPHWSWFFRVWLQFHSWTPKIKGSSVRSIRKGLAYWLSTPRSRDRCETRSDTLVGNAGTFYRHTPSPSLPLRGGNSALPDSSTNWRNEWVIPFGFLDTTIVWAKGTTPEASKMTWNFRSQSDGDRIGAVVKALFNSSNALCRRSIQTNFVFFFKCCVNGWSS